MLSPKDAWQATLDQLQLRLDRPSFETWLGSAEFLGYEDGEFKIKVRHAFAKDWLEQHLLPEMTRMLSRISSRAVSISLVVTHPHRRKAASLCDAGPLFATLPPEAEAVPAPAPAVSASAAPAASQSTTDLLSSAVASGAPAQAEKPAAVPAMIPATVPAAVTTSAAPVASTDYSEWDPRVSDVRSTSELDQPAVQEEALPLNPAYTFAAFVTGPSNEFAHAAAKAVSEAPGARYNPLVIHGGVGLGKTHLLHAIGHALREAGKQALYVTAETFTNETIAAIRARKTEELRQRYRRVDVLLLDDMQFMAGKTSTEEEFYHTFNTIVGRGGQVVIATNLHPQQIDKLDERLRSRLQGGLITDIQAPEQPTRQAILQVKSSAQGVTLPDDVAQTLAKQALANVRELEGLLTQVLARAQLSKQPLTVALAEQILRKQGLQAPQLQPASLTRIFQATATYHQLSMDDLLSTRRTQKIARARQVAMYLAREETTASLPQIGEALGGRNHSTVLHGYRKIAESLKADAVLQTEIDSIRRSLFSKD